MKYVGLPVAGAAVILVVMLAGHGMVIVGGIFACWLAALINLVACFLAVGARRPKAAEPDPEASRPRLGVVLIAGLLTIVVCVWMAMFALGRTRVYAKSPITSANLRGIGQGMELYHKEWGDYPPTIKALATSRHCSAEQFRAVGDPDNVRIAKSDGPSSFILQPGTGKWRTDPELILAFEREQWTPTELRLFPINGRQVLFADGSVECIASDEFAVAQRNDAKLRAAIGWPLAGSLGTTDRAP